MKPYDRVFRHKNIIAVLGIVVLVSVMLSPLATNVAVAAEKPVQSGNIVFILDASGSMWGQIDGRSKMEIAKTTLEEVSYWLPNDLDLALRTYGSTTASEKNNCADSNGGKTTR